ncbi:glycosyltransferase family 2 protein [Acidimicrobium ferrooxidans]|uniref:Glycosyltransferase family 2 protein n=1 Tax=Acidimicrobium ferrooxidans TaxID=53635 RepID=A0ABS3ANX6_9ACTN|nr:glycosyltransferase family 2 protein [Acidimicrobium ferrooxidans]
MDHDPDNKGPLVSVVLPCLNEAESVAGTVVEALAGLSKAGISGEVIVVDNGSHDGSPELARDAGARVVHESVPGYGAALRRGIGEAKGQIGVMADADLTYDLNNVGVLLAKIEAGSDLVIASRLDGANLGTMPLTHRLIGTPAISFILRRLTADEVRIRDSQSGYRAFKLDRVRELELQTNGMEFASEMLLRAGETGLVIDEVRLPYRARVGESKLNPMTDGVRHLKLLTLLAPKLALLWPGVATGVLGLVLTGASLLQPDGLTLGEARWQPVFFAPILLVVASLLLVSYLVLGVASPLTDKPGASPRVLRIRLANIGVGLITSGVALNGVLFVRWASGADAWSRNLALAGMAQGLTLSGAVWAMSAFLYWLLQRQSEYRAYVAQ